MATAPAAEVASSVRLGSTARSGAMVSCTVTVKVLVLAFSVASVAVMVTVVVPNPNVLPLAGDVVTTGAGSTTSVAVGAKVATAPEGLVASKVMLAKAAITGAVVSCTVTVKLPVLTFPASSVAEVATVAVPMAKVDPLAGLQTTVTAPSTLSVAVGVKLTTAPAAEVASTVRLAKAANTGAVMSFTVMRPVSVAPKGSVAV